MPDTNADPIAAADPVAAALEEIRADHEAANYFGALADDPVPRLLAAVEITLAVLESWETDNRARELIGIPVSAEIAARSGALRAAISRALLGEEPADA